MVAKRDNVVGQRVQSPAHGHNPLEIMTQQDYTQHPIISPSELVQKLRNSAPLGIRYAPGANLDRFHTFLLGYFVGGIAGIVIHAYLTNTLFAR